MFREIKNSRTCVLLFTLNDFFSANNRTHVREFLTCRIAASSSETERVFDYHEVIIELTFGFTQIFRQTNVRFPPGGGHAPLEKERDV